MIDRSPSSNAEAVKSGEGKQPPQLFSDINATQGKSELVSEKLKILNRCKNLSIHKKTFIDLDEAIKQACYLAILFAQADELMYRKEREQLEQQLKEAKEGVKKYRFTLSDEVKEFRKMRSAAKESIKKHKKQKDFRGHNVEWSSVVVRDGSGKYRVVGATPGGGKRSDGTTQPADDISKKDLENAGLGDLYTISAEIHSHPRFGDRSQADTHQDIDNSGLYPSDPDREYSGVQAMVNQRGRVVKYQKGKSDAELSEGITKRELKKNEYGAMTAIKQGENKDRWQQDLDEVSALMNSIDREKLKELQGQNK
ncbi:hypothetical protein [Portibacter marinus]|uniref:hypothetical protein n=1 Tax=Portibacter marinus TaxID=2898660 RepID=UPI001F40B11E|nr:hypothetical protein [Portibacter marinus]